MLHLAEDFPREERDKSEAGSLNGLFLSFVCS